ncbi:MAG: hypothetical protein ACK528_14185 [Alphaproteobacteria bacterium]|jgi:hypothetical protein
MPNLKTVLAEATAIVQNGNAFQQRIADGGYSLRVQRTQRRLSNKISIVTHVWHQSAPGTKSRLLTKQEVQALIA